MYPTLAPAMKSMREREEEQHDGAPEVGLLQAKQHVDARHDEVG